jgi:hypothetical protein
MFAVAPRIHAPELAPGEWLNSPRPVRLADWRGRAVLVDIWDFTCVNCLRTLAYLRPGSGPTGTCRSHFSASTARSLSLPRTAGQVAPAVRRLGIEYTVLLDNEYRNWDAFANRCWPSLYLIDIQGHIRYQHAGEGAYDEIEAALAGLAAEAAGLSGAPQTAQVPRPLGGPARRRSARRGVLSYDTRAAHRLQSWGTGEHRGLLAAVSAYDLSTAARG